MSMHFPVATVHIKDFSSNTATPDKGGRQEFNIRFECVTLLGRGGIVTYLVNVGLFTSI